MSKKEKPEHCYWCGAEIERGEMVIRFAIKYCSNECADEHQEEEDNE